MSRLHRFTPIIGRLLLAVACAWCAPIAAAAADAVVALPALATPATLNGTIDASWATGIPLTLATDYTNRRASFEATSAVIARDGDAIDIAFDAKQRESQIATQQTNGSAVLADDYVGVYFWPQGTRGFSYSFLANPRGARYQTSSENSAYAPQWTAVAKSDATGYVVTMRVPLGLIRSGGSTDWKVQLVRSVVATNSLDVWTYSPNATSATDPVYAGEISDVIGQSVAARPKPRAQVYALGELTTPNQGGNTSRLGADLSLPVTPTSSIVAALHPDYSNVEIDQQTISPSAFAYQYSEVRPFFTQVGQAFNANLSCSNCPTLLYTPSIPTFGDGYAYEGTQGHLTFAAFDTVGYGRNDQGQTVDYSYSNPGYVVAGAVQHIGADTSDGVHDEVTNFTAGVLNHNTHVFFYANGAIDRGSLINAPGAANYLEAGGGVVTPLLAYGANYQQIGGEFAPYDGFVAQNDIAGYESFYRQTFNFSPRDILHDISTSANAAEYHNHFGLRAQEYASGQVNFDLRDLISVHAFLSESAVRIERGEFLPFDGNGLFLGYRSATATPSSITYSGGPYYHGKLDSWSYLATLSVAPRVHLRLESDEDKYITTFPGELPSVLWLDRATLDWQVTRDASFDFGARKLIGTPLPNAYGFAPVSNLFAGNFTAAFHLLQAKNEFYIVYGDPNSLVTKPALYLKWIRYIGAPKGT